MSTHDLQAAPTTAATEEDRVAAAIASGASFVLDGTVRPEGDDLLVTARLIDKRGNLAVWSSEYRRVADERDFMQEQIAVNVARVLRCALISLRDDAGGIEPATLSLFLRACDKMGNSNSSTEETYLIAKEVTERAPGFSRGWSMRARMATGMAFFAAGEEAQAFAAEAREAAARSRRLDRRNGESYLTEADLLDSQDWRGRQALIGRALATEPDLAAAHAAQAYFYLEIGRAREALSSIRRAAALEPLNAEYWDMSPPLLSAVGGEDNQREANELRDRLYRVWPNDEGARQTRFMNALYVGDPAAALQMLDDIEAAPLDMHPLAQARWRSFLLARQSGDPARLRRAALALRDLIPGKYSRTAIASALSTAGEVDVAYDVLHAAMELGARPNMVFMAPWANMRRDRRFMTLFRDTGRIEYWRETGRWPDFCGAPDLPYNCAEEASRVLSP
jgi:hypothetical protein